MLKKKVKWAVNAPVETLLECKGEKPGSGQIYAYHTLLHNPAGTARGQASPPGNLVILR